ncbi:MAG: acetyl-CoA C-acyltransferase [Gammaproteobacteria bacterium]
MMQKNAVAILSAARTPLGNLLGVLKDVTAPQLGATVIKAVYERAQLSPENIEEVIMGCVLPAGIGQAPARQAALAAGITIDTPCTTINKMCGSGMKAVMFAHDGIIAGSNSIYIAGGMESMTNAPYLLPKARQGYRLGHSQLIDHMMLDGLEDAYDKGRAMGYFAEQCATAYGFTREEQDKFSIASLERAQNAISKKLFTDEIVPVVIKTRQGDVIVSTDERPSSVKIEKIPTLSPVFAKDGTVTAANSSSISDGAAALLLMSSEEADKRGLKPQAYILGHSSHAKSPDQFTTAPIEAIRKVLKKVNWTIDQVDLFEINEAFAVVSMAAMRDLNISHDKLNIHGGAVALGHPIGASGARIIVTLLSALQSKGLQRGIAALCIGGGEATAVAIEMA